MRERQKEEKQVMAQVVPLVGSEGRSREVRRWSAQSFIA